MKSIKIDESYARYRGEIEFEYRNPRTKQTISKHVESNIVKIPAKEILAHRLAHRRVWDPIGGTGAGEWVDSNVDINEEMSVKYMVFGASFDEDGMPLNTADERYYTIDQATNQYVPISLSPGCEFEGGLINPIPISEPGRPLKRIERVYFEESYQPAGSPTLNPDVRSINNVVVFETTLTKDEYNGLSNTSSDFFTITEVALVAAKEIGSIGDCEKDPHDLFLEGRNGEALLARATGAATVTLDSSELDLVNLISAGDQIKIVTAGGTAESGELNQVTPFYLVTAKSVGGSDLLLDRTPVDYNGQALTGAIGIFRDGFRIFSHRVLKSPHKKSIEVELIVRWRVFFN